MAVLAGKPYKGHIPGWYVFGNQVCGLFEDGRFIRTSAIQTLASEYVETRNSVYSLGEHESGLTAG